MTDHEDRPSDPEPAEPAEAASPPEPGFEIPWRLAIFLAVAVVIVVFAVQNTQSVELRFLGWTWQLPLVIIILVAVVLSVVLDEVVGGMFKRRRRRLRLERQELRRLRGEG